MFSRVKHNYFFSILLIISMLIIVFLNSVVLAETHEISKEKKLFYTNIAGISAITLWGVANWDYFDTEMNSKNEGWFSENTKYGGSDKFGHYYISYSTSRLLSHIFNDWGYSVEKGALFGSVSSFAMMSWMEIGDSFSSYGFSYEDFLMNSFGCFTGYCLAVNPDLSKKIDIRVEYLPDFKTTDIFTDYDNTRYLIAVKLEGFEAIKNEIAKYLEFQIGYYTKYYPEAVNRKRNIFLGIGVNLSRILNRYSLQKTASITRYIQVPYTYLHASHNLND